MASVSGMPPMLRLRRSAQSGNFAMAAAYAVAYTESSTQVYLFAGAEIDLQTMAAGDAIDIRIRKRLADGAAWVNHDTVTFTGAQPAAHPSIAISGIPDVFGVEISMRQTAGVLRTIPVEAFDAKRLGLV